MTLGNMLFELMMRLKRTEATVTVSRPTLKVIVNEALQYAYQLALRSDYTFFIKSHTGTGATITYPTSFYKTLYVEVAAATDGQAREASNREYQTVLNNTFEGVSATAPLWRATATGLTLNTSVTWVHYYLWTFPYQDTEATDITVGSTAIIPWLYEEVVILKAMEIARIRHNFVLKLDPSELQEQLASAERAAQGLYETWKPLEIYKQETPQPAA
jgi:hypothetical protein